MHPADRVEREALDALLDAHPAPVAREELARYFNHDHNVADAIAGLRRFGLVHTTAGDVLLLAAAAPWLASLDYGDVQHIVEVLLGDYLAPRSYQELDAETRPGAHTAAAMDELLRRGVVHCMDGDGAEQFWPTRAAWRFEQLAGVGCLPTTSQDELSCPRCW